MNQKEKGIMEKQYLEITLESDKRAVAAILVANGYSVCVEVVSNGKTRGKKMLAYWKEEKVIEKMI